jgi:hypothetical protein
VDSLKKIYGHKYFMPGMVLLIVLGIAWWNKDAIKKMFSGDKGTTDTTTKEGDKGTGTGGGTNTTTTTTPTAVNEYTIVKADTRGDVAKEMQKLLNAELALRNRAEIDYAAKKQTVTGAPAYPIPSSAGVAPLVVDGHFGAKSVAMLNRFTGKESTTIRELKLHPEMYSINTASKINVKFGSDAAYTIIKAILN